MEEEGQDGYMLQEQSMQGYGNSMAPGYPMQNEPIPEEDIWQWLYIIFKLSLSFIYLINV